MYFSDGQELQAPTFSGSGTLTEEEEAFELSFGRYCGEFPDYRTPKFIERYAEAYYKAWFSRERPGETLVDIDGYENGKPICGKKTRRSTSRDRSISKAVRSSTPQAQSDPDEETTDDATGTGGHNSGDNGMAGGGTSTGLRTIHGHCRNEQTTNFIAEGMAGETHVLENRSCDGADRIDATEKSDGSEAVFLSNAMKTELMEIEKEVKNTTNIEGEDYSEDIIIKIPIEHDFEDGNLLSMTAQTKDILMNEVEEKELLDTMSSDENWKEAKLTMRGSATTLSMDNDINDPDIDSDPDDWVKSSSYAWHEGDDRVCCRLNLDESGFSMSFRDMLELHRHPERYIRLCCRYIRKRSASPNSNCSDISDDEDEATKMKRLISEKRPNSPWIDEVKKNIGTCRIRETRMHRWQGQKLTEDKKNKTYLSSLNKLDMVTNLDNKEEKKLDEKGLDPRESNSDTLLVRHVLNIPV